MDDYFPQLLQEMEKKPAPEVIALLEQATLRHQADPRPWLMLGAEHAQTGNLAAAEQAYSDALERWPELAIARFQLGLLQLSDGRMQDAQETWSLIDKLEESHPLRLFKSGLIYLAGDRYTEALQWLRQGLLQPNDNPPLWRDMQRVIDEIVRLQEAGEVEDDAAAAQEHILVSTYKKLH